MIFGEKIEKQYINVAKNINIAICSKGAGPPLLLLHGYPQTGYMWHKIAPRLAEDFTVVVADLRGYGDSDKPTSSEDPCCLFKTGDGCRYDGGDDGAGPQPIFYRWT